MCARARALEVEAHLRSGTKEDVFPRATGVEVEEEMVEVDVEGGGRTGVRFIFTGASETLTRLHFMN